MNLNDFIYDLPEELIAQTPWKREKFKTLF